MALSEFELIERYFAGRRAVAPNVLLGIGDDCALLKVPPGMTLAVSVDTSIAGVHFPDDMSPADVGYRSLAVNLSDLAAMGAEPSWFTLALTISRADEAWLSEFSAGLFELAERFSLPLVGGDVTRGPLSISIQVGGLIPDGKALLRSGARAGDAVYATGSLGDAAAALALRGDAQVGPSHRELFGRLHRPTPRIEAGMVLRDLASACIDVSDGLVADLGHVLKRSGVGARIELQCLPRSAAFRELAEQFAEPDALVLGGGDDYELCCTVPPEREVLLQARFAELQCPITRIGRVEAEPGLRCVDARGEDVPLRDAGYRHF